MEWIEVSEIRSTHIPFVELNIHDMEILKEFILIVMSIDKITKLLKKNRRLTNWKSSHHIRAMGPSKNVCYPSNHGY